MLMGWMSNANIVCIHVLDLCCHYICVSSRGSFEVPPASLEQRGLLFSIFFASIIHVQLHFVAWSFSSCCCYIWSGWDIYDGFLQLSSRGSARAWSWNIISSDWLWTLCISVASFRGSQKSLLQSSVVAAAGHLTALCLPFL